MKDSVSESFNNCRFWAVCLCNPLYLLHANFGKVRNSKISLGERRKMNEIKSETILVVDDSHAIIMLISEVLGIIGYAIDTALSGEEALRKISLKKPDLILLDIEMPGMSGFEVCRKIKGDASTKDIPIIFVTGNTDFNDELEGFRLGALDYIYKPFNAHVFQARIKNHLELNRLHKNERNNLKRIKAEKDQSEILLHNILPETVVGKLKKESGVIAEDHPDVTVLFADIVGFTELSSKISAHRLVTILNDIFSAFDGLAEKFGMEKIKTIGDAYMAVGGISESRDDHPIAIADMALEMIEVVSNFSSANGTKLNIRVGLSTGPVMAGVVGLKKFIFDLWGDTVNVASRMESLGIPGNIQVSPSTYQRLQNDFIFEKRGIIHVKGKGEMPTYYLLGKSGGRPKTAVMKEILKKGEASHAMARAKAELATLPLADHITGTHSRNGFLSLVLQQELVASRENRRMQLMLARLDNLEHINDTYNIDEGERALKEVARLLYKVFRTSDLVGRVGENLFLVFGLEVSKTDKKILSYRFRDILESYKKEPELEYPIDVHLSEAKWDPNDPISLEDLLSDMEKKLI